MKLTSSTVQMLLIEGAEGLDPIRVITHNERPGAGRIIIQCWDRAWAGFWGSMGSREGPSTVEQFFARMEPDYIEGNLRCSLRSYPDEEHQPDEYEVERASQLYMVRIIEAMQHAFREQAAKPAPRFPMVSCSHCAQGFGPGDAGFFHCDTHAHLKAVET